MSQVKKKLPTLTGGENETASLKPPLCTYIHKYQYKYILYTYSYTPLIFELGSIILHSHMQAIIYFTNLNAQMS